MNPTLTLFATSATVLGTLVTAVATVFLWRVTRTLAVETKRMAEASARPQVVAIIEPNKWAMMYADLRIENTGNATAFDIDVRFDPKLPRDSDDAEDPTPLSKVSVLTPGQNLTGYLAEFQPLLKKVFTVTVSWKRDPSEQTREVLTYTLDMNDLEGLSRLGEPDPLIQIASQVKNIREDWSWIARGSKKLSVNTFSSLDRDHERRQLARMRRQRKRLAEQEQAQKGEARDSSAG